MRHRFILLSIGFIIVTISCAQQEPRRTAATVPSQPTSSQQSASRASLHNGAAPHGHERQTKPVPAFQTDAESLKNLPRTLAPELFTGNVRQAYQLVKEIPQTIAQLPCYCHCDRSIGHKSLHSCFVDDHASGCGICMEEAVMAYRLQKEQHLKPEQIRERIIAHYSSKQ